MDYKKEDLIKAIETTPLELENYLNQNNLVKDLYTENDVRLIQNYFQQKNGKNKILIRMMIAFALLLFALLLVVVNTLVAING